MGGVAFVHARCFAGAGCRDRFVSGFRLRRGAIDGLRLGDLAPACIGWLHAWRRLCWRLGGRTCEPVSDPSVQVYVGKRFYGRLVVGGFDAGYRCVVAEATGRDWWDGAESHCLDGWSGQNLTDSCYASGGG